MLWLHNLPLTTIHSHRSCCCCPFSSMPHKVANLKLPLFYALHFPSLDLSWVHAMTCIVIFGKRLVSLSFFLSFISFAFSSFSAFFCRNSGPACRLRSLSYAGYWLPNGFKWVQLGCLGLVLIVVVLLLVFMCFHFVLLSCFANWRPSLLRLLTVPCLFASLHLHTYICTYVLYIYLVYNKNRATHQWASLSHFFFWKQQPRVAEAVIHLSIRLFNVPFINSKRVTCNGTLLANTVTLIMGINFDQFLDVLFFFIHFSFVSFVAITHSKKLKKK